MRNHKLTILIKGSKKKALRQQLLGPLYRQTPNVYWDLVREDKKRISNLTDHEKSEVQRKMNNDAESTREAFRKAHKNYPSWMPVSYSDALIWCSMANFTRTSTYDSMRKNLLSAFSLPACIPETPALFSKHFPGNFDEKGWWHPQNPDPENKGWHPLTEHITSVNQEIFAEDTSINTGFFNFKIPSHVSYEMQMIDTEDACNTDLRQILRDILRPYGAKAIHTWKNTLYYTAGWAFIDPAKPLIPIHTENPPSHWEIGDHDITDGTEEYDDYLRKKLLSQIKDSRYKKLNLWTDGWDKT